MHGRQAESCVTLQRDEEKKPARQVKQGVHEGEAGLSENVSPCTQSVQADWPLALKVPAGHARGQALVKFG